CIGSQITCCVFQKRPQMRFRYVPFRASLEEPHRISIKRFTKMVPKMPKYMQEMDLTEYIGIMC
ncbi:MAG: hypothetical protein QG605_749, partial [Euryarchaeota archaeon]|nr:hypothetical protein [Euryarchaeota archaeon]